MAVGVPHPSVVVAAMPQSLGVSLQVGSLVDSLSDSVVVGNSEVQLRPAKVQHSLVSTVAVVDILLVLRYQPLRIFPVEFAYNLWGVFQVFGWVPSFVWVVEVSPLDLILDLFPVSS